MKKLVVLLVFLLCGCCDFEKSYTNFNVVRIDYIDQVDCFKLYDKKLYFTAHNNPIMMNNSEVYDPDALYEYKGDKLKKIVETAFFQGKIYDYFIDDEKVVYLDYSPYDDVTNIVIMDDKGNKTIVDTIVGTLSKAYQYENNIYYVKQIDKKFYVLDFNIQTLKKRVLKDCESQQVLLGGQEGIVWWYDDGCYSIYDGKNIDEVYTNNKTLRNIIVSDNYLYAIERVDGTAMLVKYDLITNKMMMSNIYLDSFVVTKDYFTTILGTNDLNIYDKASMNLLEKVKIDGVRNVIAGDNNNCTIILEENAFIELDLDILIN